MPIKTSLCGTALCCLAAEWRRMLSPCFTVRTECALAAQSVLAK